AAFGHPDRRRLRRTRIRPAARCAGSFDKNHLRFPVPISDREQTMSARVRSAALLAAITGAIGAQAATAGAVEFTSDEMIVVANLARCDNSSVRTEKSTPYGAGIDVDLGDGARVGRVRVTLRNLYALLLSPIRAALVSPDGRPVMVMAGAGLSATKR